MGEKYDFHLFVGRPDSETTSACDITAKCANKHCSYIVPQSEWRKKVREMVYDVFIFDLPLLTVVLSFLPLVTWYMPAWCLCLCPSLTCNINTAKTGHERHP